MSKIDLIPQVDSVRQCSDGILEEYMKYVDGQESPLDYHTWTCMGLVAIALGRRVWLDMGAWKTYPNMYIILVGESAITHKSTALKMGLGPLVQAVPELTSVAEKFTPQSLSSYMGRLTEDTGSAELFIHSSELSVLLGQSRLDDTLLKLLTDLWDSPDKHKYMTLGRGIEEARNVCINLLGGSTPSWLKNSVPEEGLEGGFFSRLILVNRQRSGIKNPFPFRSQESRKALEKVKHDLRVIHQHMAGNFELTPPAYTAYSEWYTTMNHPEKADSFMRGYYGRKGDFVIKLAMINSALYSNNMKITDEDILAAIELLNANEKHVHDIVKYMGMTIDGKKYNAVLKKIKQGRVNFPENPHCLTAQQLKSGDYATNILSGMDHSELMRKMSYQLKASDLAEIIDAMEQAGEIRTTMLGSRKIYLMNES